MEAREFQVQKLRAIDSNVMWLSFAVGLLAYAVYELLLVVYEIREHTLSLPKTVTVYRP